MTRPAPCVGHRRTHLAYFLACEDYAYFLACEDYEGLAAKSGEHCELCGITGPETPHRILHIDHDAKVGGWAVRGLLCSRCNTLLDRGLLAPEPVARYLATPWWREVLVRHGVDLAPGIEPPIGSTMRGPGSRQWTRRRSGWVGISHHGSTLTWTGLHRRIGPHNLTLLPGLR